MPAMRSTLGLLLALAVGCGDDGSPGNEEGTTSGTTTQDAGGSTADAASSTGDPDDTSTSTTGADSSSGGFEPPMAECGNGFIEDGEECDDANTEGGDGCSSDCRLRCGLDWTLVSLPPTDTSDINPIDVVVDGRGGAVVAGFLREVTTDQEGNETTLDDEGVIVRASPDGRQLWATRLAERGADVDVAGVAVDAAGNAYVAASVAVVGEQSDIWLYKLDAAGEQVWSSSFDSEVDSAEDLASGVAIGPEGNPVVSGQVRVGPGDDDIWIGSFDEARGGLEWSASWSGEGTEDFSTDDGGPIAISEGGVAYVFAREYVGVQDNIATIVAFDGDTPVGPVFSTDFGLGPQNQLPRAISVEDSGTLMATYRRVLAAGIEDYVVRIDPADGSELWSLDAQMVAEAADLPGAAEFTIEGADGVSGGAVVVGMLERTADDASWAETWVARYDAQNALECVFVRESPALTAIPGSLFGRAISAGPSGRAVVGGQQVAEGVQSLWLGAFRPD